jgi:signal transduction histidine kinase
MAARPAPVYIGSFRESQSMRVKTPIQPAGCVPVSTSPAAAFANSRPSNELRRLQGTARRQQRALQQAQQQLVLIHEATQRQIGQELHDDVGQLLGGAALQAGGLALRLGLSQPQLCEQAQLVVHLLNQAAGKVRDLSHGLYPVATTQAGLPDLLQGLAGHLALQPVAVVCEMAVPEPETLQRQLAPQQVLQLYRIAQEALRNSLRHSQASRVRIALLLQGQRLRLRITDNGGGLSRPSAQSLTGGIGIPSMRQRAAAIGASLCLRNRPGSGFCVSVSLDLPRV